MQQLHKNCQHDACLEERPKMESKPKIPTFSSKANTPPVMMQSSWIAFLDPVAIVQLICPMIFKLLILPLQNLISGKTRAD